MFKQKAKHLLLSILLAVTLLNTGFTIGLSQQTVKIENDISTCSILNESQLKYFYTFSTPQPRENENGVLFLVDGLDTTNNPGKPMVPKKTLRLLLPPDTDIKDVRVYPSSGSEYRLPYSYTIAWGQQPVPLCHIGDVQKTDADMDVYGSYDRYPGVFYELVSLQYKHGFPVFTINLFPLQYVPKTGEVYFHSSLELDLTLESAKMKDGLVMPIRMCSEDAEEIADMVDNPEILDIYKESSLLSRNREIKEQVLDNPSTAYKYVVITNEALRDSQAEYTFQDLIQSKINKGLTATIVTVEDIVSNPLYWWNGPYGDGDPLFNDTPCIIRNFIRYAYLNWATEYILLGGDGDGEDLGGQSGDDIIPVRGLYDYNFPYGNPEGDFTIASDLYYACLDGSYDSNKNMLFGEPDDGFDINPNGEVDLLAEVYVGRAPVDNATELSNFVRKTIMYEQSRELYLRDVLMVGERIGFGGVAEWGGNYKDEIKDGSSNHGYTTVGVSKLYNISALYDRDWPGHNWPKVEISNRINQGVHVINHLGHGNNFHVMKLDEPVRWNGEVWSPIHDILNLTNDQYFFMYSQACYPGAFDNRGPTPPYGNGGYFEYDSIVEHMLASKHGAFACVANTRYGWGAAYSTAGPSQYFDREFFDALYGEGIRSLGRANQDSKEDNIGDIGYPLMRFCYYEITLFGDPEVSVKPYHNLGVLSVDCPKHVSSGSVVCVNATLENNGIYDEIDVRVGFLVDGAELDSLIIPYFKAGSKELIRFFWVPLLAGEHNLTINVTISNVIEDFYCDNEKDTMVKVGVLNKDTGELFNTIQEAIDDPETLSGHQIIVPSGVYRENLFVTKGVHLIGSDKKTTVIDGEGGVSVTVDDVDSLIMNGFTICNGSIGVLLSSTNKVVILDNDIIDNYQGVVVDSGCSGNLIYHNNFNNIENAFDDGLGTRWNHSYYVGSCSRPVGGNWWSDYTGDDLFRGPQQNIHGSDGIIDTPRSIPGYSESQDKYPLKKPWIGWMSVIINVDDDFNESTPGWGIDHFNKIQDGLSKAQSGDVIMVYDGTYKENIIIDKSVDLIGEDRNMTIIDGGGDGNVVSITADQVYISGFTIRNSGRNAYDAGILMISNNISIIDNVFIYNSKGVLASGVSHCTIMSNVFDTTNMINNPTEIAFGIELVTSEYNSIISNIFKCSSLSKNSGGVSLRASSYNTLMSNTFNKLSSDALWLIFGSMFNDITGNKITNNGGNGILILGSSNANIIKDNFITKNDKTGIWIFPEGFSSQHNRIYHNDLIANGINAVDDFGGNKNKWDDGYPSGGNYWSDYTGDDQFSGPEQNNPGSDGIGDTPYVIRYTSGSPYPPSVLSRDRYPLMKMQTNVMCALISAPSSSYLGENIQFKGFACGGAPPYTWLWDFGDENTSTEQNPYNLYIHPGVYIVNLTVTDSENNIERDTTTVTVIFTVNASGPYKGYVNEPIKFMGSIQGGFPPFIWSWDFGDGNYSYEQNPSYTYQKSGEFIVTLTVIDDKENVAVNTTFATILPPKPSTVYVSQEYNTSTPGWNITHFNMIVRGINAVASYGTVIVSPGEYKEVVGIYKPVTLYGIDKTSTILKRPYYLSNGYVISIVMSNVNITGFTILGPGYMNNIKSYGIDINNNVNNVIISNCIISQHKYGVYLSKTKNVKLTGNTIIDNGEAGIGLYGSSNNCITQNVIRDNYKNGIIIYSGGVSQNNRIYHNTFVNNHPNVYNNNQNFNFWDNGYTGYGGNYWDDWAGQPDEFQGSYQNITGADGIIDQGLPNGGLKPYPIQGAGGNQDYYPLKHPFILGDMNHDGKVDFNDIDPFVLAIAVPGRYQEKYRMLPGLHGDINQDGKLDFGDINPFIELLTTS
ncbi:MAG: C25 family cysteine peptidase [Candidatus Thermoplasmatota archaeon]